MDGWMPRVNGYAPGAPRSRATSNPRAARSAGVYAPCRLAAVPAPGSCSSMRPTSGCPTLLWRAVHGNVGSRRPGWGARAPPAAGRPAPGLPGCRGVRAPLLLATGLLKISRMDAAEVPPALLECLDAVARLEREAPPASRAAPAARLGLGAAGARRGPGGRGRG